MRDGVVAVVAEDLEVDCEEEGLEGGAAGVGMAKGDGGAVVGRPRMSSRWVGGRHCGNRDRGSRD